MGEMPLRRELIEELARTDSSALVELVLQQSAAIAQQRQAIAALEKRVRQLEEALEQRGGGPPGAAPFRIEPHRRKALPKRPGRSEGHRGEFRIAPEQIEQTIEVKLEQCPACGSAMGKTIPVQQNIIELPLIRPLTVRLITHRGRCPGCGRVVQSRHPLQVSRACGAAATQLGPRALASAALLRHGVGLTVRSCCTVLDKLQNERSMLWVFATPQCTLYRVVEHRDRATLHQTIGADYGGVLVSDCLSVYDDATILQHKCYAHHLKAIAAAQSGRASPSGWLSSMEALLKSAIGLSKERAAFEQQQWERRLSALHLAAHAVLEETPRPCPQEEAVRARLWKQRDHLFVFLEKPGVNATNNLAERQLRPAVIRRKLSCGNKTRRGARTFEILTSLAATCRQRGEDFIHLASNAARISQPA